MNNLFDLLASVNSVSSANSVLNNPEPGTANPELSADGLEDLELHLEHAQAMAQDSPPGHAAQP